METPDFTLLGSEEAAQAALQLTAKQFESQLPNLSPDQLQATLPYLSLDHDPNWRAKIRSLLIGITHRPQLEAIGRSVSPPQLIELLEFCADSEASIRDRLQFVLVGLRQPVFEAALYIVSDVQIRVLKGLGNTESLQHHLTLMVHELARQAQEHATSLEDLERRIEAYDVRSVRQNDVDEFLNQLEGASTFFLQGLTIIDRALGLAWNTNREDLIDRLTQLKESWIRYLQFAIGRPGTSERPSTALYQKLEVRLNAIFGDPTKPNGEEPLADEDPAIEALAALSLWVLQDYWEVGLLPGIEHAEDLDLDPATHTEKEVSLYRERLAAVAQENLNAIGLATVADLKRAHIYSRNMLIRYIQRNRERLASLS